MFDWWWEFLLRIVQFLLQLVDGIYKIFLVLAGAAPASVQQEVTGSNIDSILDVFFKNTAIQTVFWAFMIISFFFFILSIIIGIARSEVVGEDNKQPKIKVLKRATMSLFTVLLMPVIFGIAIMATSFLLGAIVEVMGGTIYQDSNLAQKIFEICLPNPQKELNGPIFWNDAVGTIAYYYPLNEFNYVIGFLGTAVILFILAIAALNLVERLINVVMLFLVSPFVLAASPLDDGQRLGVWRDLVISKLLGVAGMVLSLYLYFILLDVMSGIFVGTSFLSKFAYLIFAIGGALSATKGGMMIANLVGHNTALIEGQQQSHSAHLVGAGLMTGVRTATGLLTASVGLLSRGAKAAAGAVGTAYGGPAGGAAASSAAGMAANAATAPVAMGANFINSAMQSSTNFAAQKSSYDDFKQGREGKADVQQASNNTTTQQIVQNLNAGQQNLTSQAPPTEGPAQQAAPVSNPAPSPAQSSGNLNKALNEGNKGLGDKKE